MNASQPPYLIVRVLVFLAFGFQSCVKEIEPDDTGAANYLYVDGGVTVGETEQVIQIGRTPAPGSRQPLPVDLTQLAITDLDAGSSYPLTPCADDEDDLSYCATFTGRLATDYQLSFTLADGSRFESPPEKLGPGTLSPAGEMILLKRPGLDGGEVSARSTALQVSFDLPSEGTDGILVLIPRELVYLIVDRSCSPFDGAGTCYRTAPPSQQGPSIINLSTFAGGERFVGTVGREPLDWRFAFAVYQQYVYERVSAAAESYYSSLQSSLALSGSFFAERPLTIGGNVRYSGAAGAGEPVLGYFGVREKGILRAKSDSPEIRADAPQPPCGGPAGGPVPGDLGDCCDCLTVSGASSLAPEWWE